MIKYFKKATLILACLLMGGQSVLAYDWEGNELTSVLSEVKDDNGTITASDKTDAKKTVFLYNVATGKFLNMGDAWGTHPIIEDVGIRCWLMKHSYTSEAKAVASYDGYLIETACSNAFNPKKGDKFGFDNGDLFLDIKNVSGGGNGYTYWDIRPISTGSNTYYLILSIPNDSGNMVEKYLCVDEKGNKVALHLENNRPKDLKRAQWRLVTEQDLVNLFNKTAVELGGQPADATFMLGDYDFNRYSTELERWNFESESGTLRVGIDYHYQAYNASMKTWTWNKGAGDTSGDDKGNGRYWCAKINGGAGMLSQTIKVSKTGWYRLSCQGEFYLKGASNNQYAFLFAKVGDNEVRQPLRMTSNAIDQFSNKDKVNAEGKRYYDEYGDYTNTVMIYVDCGKDNSKTVDLQLGVKVEGDDVPTSDIGVAVDAFRLQYCGVPADHELVLDEDFTGFDYITKETQKEYQNSILYLHRSFNLNCWNTIILPVDLTADQFNTAFGADSKLARYEGVKNNRLQFVVQDDKKIYDTEEKGAFLKANTPYIIWPTAEASQNQAYSYSTTYGTESTELHQVTVGTPYYVVNDVTLDKAEVENIVIEGEEKNGYCFNGILAQDYVEGTTNFIGDVHVKAGDYTFNAGKLYQFKGNYGMKGFRAWFTPKVTESSAKPMGVDINGVQGDEVTGLDFVKTTQNATASSVIYDLRGQKMNAKSINELPRGFYVINHKKYVVK